MKLKTSRRHEELAKQIVRVILESGGSVALQWACREVGICETVAREAFYEHTGESFEDFSRRVRLERAASLLSGSNDRICEIAAEAGYSSGSSLDRAFRTYFGCTPSLFRTLNPDQITFPSYAYEQGFEPGRERTEVGVYTAFARVTTFAYDRSRLAGRQNPGDSSDPGARDSGVISQAILGGQTEHKNE